MRWEYRVVAFDKFGIRNTTVFDSHHEGVAYKLSHKSGTDNVVPALAEALNGIGADGWELVTKEHSSDRQGMTWYIFKRLLEGS